MRLRTELFTAFGCECRLGPGFEALCGKRRNRAFDRDLVVVVVAIFGVEKPIGRAPRKKRDRHVEPCRTLN